MTTTYRMTSYRKAQEESGKRRLDVYVTDEDRDILKTIRRETRESYGEIIGRLLSQVYRPGCKSMTVHIPKKGHERLYKEFGEALANRLDKLVSDEVCRLYEEDNRDDSDF